MPLSMSANRILITDTNGATRFDTNDDFLHVTNVINGSRAFPSRTVTSTFNDGEDVLSLSNTYTLGSVNASANFVFGSIKLDYAAGGGSAGLSENAYFNISGGATYVHVLDHLGEFKPSVVYGAQPTMCAHYSFTASGGVCRLIERVYMHIVENQPNPGDTSSYTIIGFTMTYRLRVGLFT